MKLIILWYFKFFSVENVSKPRRVLIHCLFWLLFGFLLSYASIANRSWSNNLILSYLSIIQSIIFFYGVFYISIPLLSSRKTIFLGLLSFGLMSVLYSTVSYFLYKQSLDFNLFTPKSYLYDYSTNYVKNGLFSLFDSSNILFEGNMTINSLAIPLMIKFSRLIEKYSRRIEKVSREKVEVELSFLKSQINPHFLLNSLNNIYSQVISKDNNAANTIITLSKLLKYILYHSQEEYLDLAQEINFIRNFIDLEKLRNGNHLKIKFSQEGDFEGFKIAPFILINYIENAFKHGIDRKSETSVITIEITLIEDILTFITENTIYENNTIAHKEGGIGLVNTQKRLENLYDKKYSLFINQENEKFYVKLTLKLN